MKYITIIILSLLSLNITQNINEMKEVVQIKEALVVEYVTFSAKKGISKQEMLEAARSTDNILMDIKGYSHRFIALQEDNTWVEVVFWENKQLAEQGLKIFLEHPKSQIFLNKIQEGSVKIHYSDIL